MKHLQWNVNHGWWNISCHILFIFTLEQMCCTGKKRFNFYPFYSVWNWWHMTSMQCWKNFIGSVDWTEKILLAILWGNTVQEFSYWKAILVQSQTLSSPFHHFLRLEKELSGLFHSIFISTQPPSSILWSYSTELMWQKKWELAPLSFNIFHLATLLLFSFTVLYFFWLAI